jgi:formylglycine-generating enzyme required for sulfatase activity
MTRRLKLLAAFTLSTVAGTAALVPAKDDAKALETPADAKVPAKLDLPPKTFTETLPGGIKFEMVYVPGGTFDMGSPETEAGRKDDEGPRHKVTIKPMWVGKTEVTWDEFDRWVKNESIVVYPKDAPFPKTADALSRPTPPFVPEDYNHGHEGYPAICMSHHAAMMYCHWLRIVTKKGYRLPTEAEWEYACRAGSDKAYSFGDAVANLGEYANYQGSTEKDDERPKGTTIKCGTKKPNAFGLFDMHGNVAEWVLDKYDADFYKKSPAVQPVNKPGDQKWGHVARGGSFKDAAEKVRSAARLVSGHAWMRNDPQSPRSIWWLTKRDEIGFRVALPVEEQKELVGLKPMVVKKIEHDPVEDN